jgi:hypothetical protein
VETLGFLLPERLRELLGLVACVAGAVLRCDSRLFVFVLDPFQLSMVSPRQPPF